MESLKSQTYPTGPTDRVLGISFALPNVPFRKIVKRSNQRATGKYTSLKTGTMIQWESIPERNTFRFLDACPSVVTYSSQSVRIEYVLNGEVKTHIPDILVKTTSSLEFWEVKTARFASEPDVEQRTQLLVSELPTRGYQYRMILAEDVALEPRFSTIATLLDYGRILIPTEEQAKILDEFAVSGPIFWGEVLENRRRRDYVARLILDGKLTLDWSLSLTDNSLIYVAGTDESETAGVQSSRPIVGAV